MGIISCSLGTLSCGRWALVPWPGIEPGAPALGAQSLIHWTTREVQAHFSIPMGKSFTDWEIYPTTCSAGSESLLDELSSHLVGLLIFHHLPGPSLGLSALPLILLPYPWAAGSFLFIFMTMDALQFISDLQTLTVQSAEQNKGRYM